MAKVRVLFDKSGDKFKVGDMCDPNNPTGCVGSFKNLLGKMAVFNESDVELTDNYFQQEELPPKLEIINETDEN